MALTNNTANISISISASGRSGTTGTGASAGVSSGTLNFGKTLQMSWIPTTGSNQITGIGFDSGTLAAAGTATIDMFGGTLLSLDGSSLVLATVKMVYVALLDSVGAAATVGSLEVGGAGSNPHKLWFDNDSDISRVEVNGPPFLQGASTGLVVDATHRNILITNPSGSTAYWQALIIGTI